MTQNGICRLDAEGVKEVLPSLSMVSYIAVDDAELPTVGCNVSCTTCDASDHSEWQELSTVDIQRIIEAKTNDDKPSSE